MYYSEKDEMPSECSRDYASKQCTAESNWFTLDVNNSGIITKAQFVDYEKCTKVGVAQAVRESILYITGYSFSLILTFSGSIIFVVYKQYKSLRVQIHLNFFVSLMLTCIFSIAYYSQKTVQEPKYVLFCVILQLILNF